MKNLQKGIVNISLKLHLIFETDIQDQEETPKTEIKAIKLNSEKRLEKELYFIARLKIRVWRKYFQCLLLRIYFYC